MALSPFKRREVLHFEHEQLHAERSSGFYKWSEFEGGAQHTAMYKISSPTQQTQLVPPISTAM
jgi:hypothetical protein